MGETILAVPLMTDQAPVTPAGSAAAFILNVLLPQLLIFKPAFAVTDGLFVIVNSSKAEHEPLLTVQRKTAEVPTGTPVTLVVALFAEPIVATPLTTDHVPTFGALTAVAAIVKLPLLHLSWSAPATGVNTVFKKTVVLAVMTDPQSDVNENVYKPAIAGIAKLMVGFCNVEVKPLGPDQLYVPLPV